MCVCTQLHAYIYLWDRENECTVILCSFYFHISIDFHFIQRQLSWNGIIEEEKNKQYKGTTLPTTIINCGSRLSKHSLDCSLVCADVYML